MTDDTTTSDDRRRTGFWVWFKRLWRVKQGYDWYDRFTWFTSMFKTNADVAMALGSLGVIGTVAAATTWDAYKSLRLAYEPMPAFMATEQRTTKSATVFTVEGFDTAGRRGLFDVVVAKKQFLWVSGSSDEIEKNGRVLRGAAITSELFDAEVTAALAGAKEVVAVGMASQEGDPATEKARAGRRAQSAAKIARRVVPKAIPISALNLGQYREPCADCETASTQWQRPFIVIAAKELASGIVLGEALADAMGNSAKLPSPSRYSAFELEQVP